jgi:2-amino-4-hydroxy-6-hydroxymethyldihydropteridine diphosphokinase
VTRAVIALGSNLGDRLANLRAAVAMLESTGFKVFERSEVWETSPVPADQPPYLNAALAGETPLQPLELLAECKRIEHSLGRRAGKRWGPRPIDLDILFYGDEAFDSDTLTIPHPRIAQRVFVLAPLADIDDDPLPVLGKTARELLEMLRTLPNF